MNFYKIFSSDNVVYGGDVYEEKSQKLHVFVNEQFSASKNKKLRFLLNPNNTQGSLIQVSIIQGSVSIPACCLLSRWELFRLGRKLRKHYQKSIVSDFMEALNRET